MNDVEAILQEIAKNPWMLCFSVLWVVGYMLKEHTILNNKLIPWVIVLIGACLGALIIEISIAGAVIGILMAYIIIGFYDHVKNAVELYIESKF